MNYNILKHKFGKSAIFLFPSKVIDIHRIEDMLNSQILFPNFLNFLSHLISL